MNDLSARLLALVQYATGSITYGAPTAGVKATGTVTVVDYTKAIEAAATGSITFGAPDNGDTVIVNGNTFTKVAAAPGAGEFTDITELEALVEAVTGVNSSENGTVITVDAATPGAAGNAITLALGGGNTGTMTISGATLTGGQDNLTVTVNGTALVQGADFTAAVDNDTTATSLAAAIDALANVSAAAVGAVVTITADAEGTTANAYNLLTSDVASATVSGATLSGGVNGDTVVVDGNTFTCVTSSPGASEFTNAAELEALVEAVAGINSSVAGGVITIKADASGAAGNAITLAVGGSNTGTMAVSGATLTGGVDATYTDAYELVDGDEDTPNEVDAVITVANIAGASAGLTVTPETSLDKEHWVARTATAALTANGDTELHIAEPLRYLRFKLVFTAGTSPTCDVIMRAEPSVG